MPLHLGDRQWIKKRWCQWVVFPSWKTGSCLPATVSMQCRKLNALTQPGNLPMASSFFDPLCYLSTEVLYQSKWEKTEGELSNTDLCGKCLWKWNRRISLSCVKVEQENQSVMFVVISADVLRWRCCRCVTECVYWVRNGKSLNCWLFWKSSLAICWQGQISTALGNLISLLFDQDYWNFTKIFSARDLQSLGYHMALVPLMMHSAISIELPLVMDDRQTLGRDICHPVHMWWTCVVL